MTDHILLTGKVLLEIDGPEGRMLVWVMEGGTFYIAAPVASVHLSEDMHEALKTAILDKLMEKIVDKLK